MGHSNISASRGVKFLFMHMNHIGFSKIEAVMDV